MKQRLEAVDTSGGGAVYKFAGSLLALLKDKGKKKTKLGGLRGTLKRQFEDGPLKALHDKLDGAFEEYEEAVFADKEATEVVRAAWASGRHRFVPAATKNPAAKAKTRAAALRALEAPSRGAAGPRYMDLRTLLLGNLKPVEEEENGLKDNVKGALAEFAVATSDLLAEWFADVFSEYDTCKLVPTLVGSYAKNEGNSYLTERLEHLCPCLENALDSALADARTAAIKKLSEAAIKKLSEQKPAAQPDEPE